MTRRRIAELQARRTALIDDSGALRQEARAHVEALKPAVHRLERAGSVMARLRRLPLRFIVTAARAGLAESLSNETRRATLIAGAATGVMALIRRWRRRSHRPGSGAPGTDSEGAAHDES